MSERQVDEETILPCPLCPDELYLKRLQTHVAEHLEEISLFVIPIAIGDGSEAETHEVVRTAPLQHREQKSDASSTSSLAFSEAAEELALGIPQKTPEEFARLLAEMTYPGSGQSRPGLPLKTLDINYLRIRFPNANEVLIQRLSLAGSERRSIVRSYSTKPGQDPDTATTTATVYYNTEDGRLHPPKIPIESSYPQAIQAIHCPLCRSAINIDVEDSDAWL